MKQQGLTVNVNKYPNVAVMTLAGFLGIYSLLNYFILHPGSTTFFDIAYYFFPIVLLFILMRVGKNHNHFEGIALIGMAVFFLGVYTLYISVLSFFVLATTGIFFLLKGTHEQRKKENVKNKKLFDG
jgi:uncharacterized membrane protein